MDRIRRKAQGCPTELGTSLKADKTDLIRASLFDDDVLMF